MSWILTAKVGDRVVCINDDWGSFTANGRYSLPNRQPMISEVLTIAELVVPETVQYGPKVVSFVFQEIEKTQTDGLLVLDIGWIADCFRPLNDRPVSISVFTDMLKTVGKPLEVVG